MPVADASGMIGTSAGITIVEMQTGNDASLTGDAPTLLVWKRMLRVCRVTPAASHQPLPAA